MTDRQWRQPAPPQGRPVRVRVLASVVMAVAIAAAGMGLAAPARAVDDYPYASATPDTIDRWGFYTRQCTSFVAWRMSRDGVAFSNSMTGPNGVRGFWGDARNWDDNARRIGFVVDNRPAPGAIAHWEAWEQGAWDLGHVAYVERVNGDGSVLISEYHWMSAYNGYTLYNYGERTVWAPRYIHVADAAPPASTTTTSSTTTSTTRPPDAGGGEPVVVDDPVASGPDADLMRVTGAGWDGDLLRSVAVGRGRPAVHAAEWSTALPAGVYRVEAFVPGQYGLAHVDYAIRHDDGWTRVQVVQSRFDDAWVPLGTYSIGDGAAVARSDDATQVRGQTIAWDALRWVPVG